MQINYTNKLDYKMIEVTLMGRHNAKFIVKNPKKIEFWKAMEKQGEINNNKFVNIKIRKIKDERK